MLDRAILQKQLSCTLQNCEIPELGERYAGKVRDCYVIGNSRVLISSDRLSAFDRILTTIPFKGQLLNDLAAFWFEKTSDIISNHIQQRPHPNVFIGEEVQILPIEVVVRGYLAGSAWRDYQSGNPVSGIVLPAGMKKSQRFETPLITPSTKAAHGQHDLPISCQEVVKQGIVKAEIWDEVCNAALRLFARGTEIAAQQGLILVDTKYEFGLRKHGTGAPQIVLADEIHTQDSSRYWEQKSYRERFAAGEDPEMFDKEFVRRWLISQGYMGEGTPPEFPDDFRIEIAEIYMHAYERLTGREFTAVSGDPMPAIRKAVLETC